MKSFIPVAGVDVSKRFSDLCVLSPDNNVLLRQKIYHDMVSMKLAEDTRLGEDVKLLCSIPGIGFSSAVVIVAEMGDISLPKQLAAHFGLDPSKRQSGTFKGRQNKLSKRGAPQVCAVLHMAAVSSVSRNRCGTYRNPVLAEYHERKCAEKPCKVARVAVMRKLSNIIYAVLRNHRPFDLRTPQEHMRLLATA